MRSYTIALFLIVFGVFYGFVGEMYSTDLPGTDLAPTTSQFEAEQMATSAESNLPDFVAGLPSLLSTVGGIMITGLITALAFYPFLVEMGVPLGLAVAINTPVWFIYIWDIVPWLLNRSRGES